PPKAAKSIKVVYILLAVLTGVMGLLLHPIFLLVFVFCLYMRYKTLNQVDFSLEYQFWARQLDIEMITGDDKHKPLATYYMDHVEIMAKEGDPALEAYCSGLTEEPAKKMDLTDHNPYGSTVYVMYVREDGELIRVRLQPSREMLRKMWQVAPRAIHIPEELKQADIMEL
ncbi:MAG: hypothetical protein IJX71_04310, partial [Oscillospiraceae bacterium]|nr:hypothetical protein [Oscillospiraceae bacterium]